MKLACLISLLLVSATGLAQESKDEQKPEVAPFVSSENVAYAPKNVQDPSLVDGPHLIGVFKRLETRSRDLYYVELYDLNVFKQIAVDDAACRLAVEYTLGRTKDIFDVAKPTFSENRYGKTCEVKVNDQFAEAAVKEYRLIVAMIHGTPYVFMAKFQSRPKSGDLKEFREFVVGLREQQSQSVQPKSSARMPASAPFKK